MAPLIEARTKSVDRVCEHAPQALELAAGFACRGARLSTAGRLYVETDLPEQEPDRSRLRAALGIVESPQLVFDVADATDPSDLERVAERLDPSRPVTIICEGLFQYLSRAEKAAVSEGIRSLLSRHGGAFYTPDFETLDDPLPRSWTDPQFRRIGAWIASTTQRDLAGAAFRDRGDVQDFFTALGFHVVARPQLDGSFHLGSAASSGATREQLDDLAASRVLWELSIPGAR
jgi:O-methyltransferase involved in polyketide biosynthesis